MNKKVIISVVCLVIAIALFAIIWNVVESKSENDEEELVEDIEDDLDVDDENYMEISNFYSVTDDCVTETTNSDLNEETTRYLLKSVDNYIYVYYLDDDNEEFLYRKTDISTDYLSQEDIDDLEVGIEVTGIEELNKLIEDFE